MFKPLTYLNSLFARSENFQQASQDNWAQLLVVCIFLAACGAPGEVDDPNVDLIFPKPDSTVNTPGFEIVVEFASLEEDSVVEISLNDQVRPSALISDDTAVVSVLPGPPLNRVLNTLEITVLHADGERDFERRFFSYEPDTFAQAYPISDTSQLLSGPLAHGQVGDFILENSVAKFVVQRGALRDLYSVGGFGGNIIDAELKGRPGLDNFLEVQPMLNFETVLNAQTVEIVNDGSDGKAAIVRACGPDDILDFVNPSTILSSFGIPFPASANDNDQNIEACTEYSLDPDVNFLSVKTTVLNNDTQNLSLFVGDLLNAAGELEQRIDGGAGVGPSLFGSTESFSMLGVGEAAGVDYALTIAPKDNTLFPGASFIQAAGVTFMLQNYNFVLALLTQRANFTVPAGGEQSYTRYFSVGDGDFANAIDLLHNINATDIAQIHGCITVPGQSAIGAKVALGPVNGEGRLSELSNSFIADDSGCFRGHVKPGKYGLAAAMPGVLYEGGGTYPQVHLVDLKAGTIVTQNFTLPATAQVSITVKDSTGDAIPARISVVGIDPSPAIVDEGFSLGNFGSTSSAMFVDVSDRLPFGITKIAYADAQGEAAFIVEPGEYEFVVSRGVEYSISRHRLTVAANGLTEISARLVKVIDTTGFVSSDFHVHGINSADSLVNDTNRVFQYAGEGVDNVVMTDHHAHTDLSPHIDALGFNDHLHSTIGEEITTWDAGHFNAYPLTVDPSRPSGGSTDWAGAAPPGEDFPAMGNYIASPSELFDLAVNSSTSTAATTVQINHIDSHFDPLKIDTSLVPPQTLLTPKERLEFRLDPNGGELFHPFPALEVWNGANADDQSHFLDERIGIWMNLLNQGIKTTAIADTDSHSYSNLVSAGARSWTPVPNDKVSEIDSADVASAVNQGKAIGGQGVFVQAVANTDQGQANLTWGGETMVSSSDGRVELSIHVQAPSWAQYDRIEIYSNANTNRVRKPLLDLIPVFTQKTMLFSAEPTVVLQKGVDFTIENVLVADGEYRQETKLTEAYQLEKDAWYVVLVKGSDEYSEPMFPVYPLSISQEANLSLDDLLDGNQSEGGVFALGFTNALYIDADGVAGFQGVQ